MPVGSRVLDFELKMLRRLQLLPDVPMSSSVIKDSIDVGWELFWRDLEWKFNRTALTSPTSQCVPVNIATRPCSKFAHCYFHREAKQLRI